MMVASTSRVLLSTPRLSSRPVSKLATRSIASTPHARLGFWNKIFGCSQASTSPKRAPTRTPTPTIAPETATVNPSPISTSEPADPFARPPPEPVVKGTMLARDQELLAKLLDREGGSAGVSIVNGKYEEGLGPETKKNMFRLI